MTSPSRLLYNTYYHIYNRGTNGENIFVEEKTLRVSHVTGKTLKVSTPDLEHNTRESFASRDNHPQEKPLGFENYVIAYIHQNPQKHGFVKDFREWKYSSYGVFLTEKPTVIKRAGL